MKLGKETGSLVNHLQSRGVIGQPVPVVGMGATMLGWSDRNPGTIVKVEEIKTAKHNTIIVHVQHDRYKRIDNNGMSESQEYEYTPDTDGNINMFRSVDGGIWQAVRRNPVTGRLIKTGGHGLRIGERERYYDFSF